MRAWRKGARFWQHILLRPVRSRPRSQHVVFVCRPCTCRTSVHRLGISATGVGATLASTARAGWGGCLAHSISRRLAFGTVKPSGRSPGSPPRSRGLSPSHAVVAPRVKLFLMGAWPVLWLISSTRSPQCPRPSARTRLRLSPATWGVADRPPSRRMAQPSERRQHRRGALVFASSRDHPHLTGAPARPAAGDGTVP